MRPYGAKRGWEVLDGNRHDSADLARCAPKSRVNGGKNCMRSAQNKRRVRRAMKRRARAEGKVACRNY